jgi:hypothetical protein
MAVTISLSNLTVPTIPNDLYAPGPLALPSVYQGQAFSMDMTFVLDDDAAPTPAIVPITTLTPSLLGGYATASFTVISTNPSAYVLRVSGTITNALPGESYQLLLEDGSLTTVAVSSVPAYRAITAWNLPTIKSDFPITYRFVLNGTVTVQPVQYVYWNLPVALTAFKSIVSGGI